MSAISFEYTAVDREGRPHRGTLSAPTRHDAMQRLASDGMTPTKLREARRSVARGGRGKKVAYEEIAHFTYQLSVLLDARIPIVTAFRSIAEQATNPMIQEISAHLAREVESGRSITEGLEKYRRTFGTVYIETIRAAETSGNMTTVLGHLAEIVDEQGEMRRLIRGATLYPATVVITLSIATLFLVTFVVPKFATMFTARGIELPMLTVILMNLGQSIKAYWYIYGAGLIGAVSALRMSWSRPRSRAVIDSLMHRLPVLHEVLTGLALSRFSGVLGIALRSGVGLIESITMAGKATGRPLLEADSRRLADQVRRGGRLRESLPECTYLTGFAKQLLTAGEEAGDIPRMCEILTKHYSRETRHRAKTLSTVLEPVLIAVLTGVVLVIALAIFLPMWDMVTVLG